MLELIVRCRHCGREHDQNPQGRRENPYCSKCVEDRLATIRRDGIEWEIRGHYMVAIPSTRSVPSRISPCL